MENQSSSFGLHTTWLSTKNLLYPCNSKQVERQDKLYCYLLVTSHILPYVGGDWVKTADWCRRSERGWAAYCFQSYGRDVAGAAVRDPAQMKNLCGMAGSGEKECIYGAIRDVMNNNPQDPQGEAFCNGSSRESGPTRWPASPEARATTPTSRRTRSTTTSATTGSGTASCSTPRTTSRRRSTTATSY